jgi:general stress protein 26
MEATDIQKKLIETIRKFDTVMVTTTADNGTMHARPMAVAEVDEDGEIWFVTSRDSGKCEEVKADARAVVTAQEAGRYCSLSGRIDVISDPDRVRALWKEPWKVWFPQGKEDPSIVLMRLRPEIGEYWDSRGTQGVRYLFEAARALLNGESADERVQDPKQHAKVAL